MIRVKHFTQAQCEEANKFMEENGARMQNGLNLGPSGIFITYEDGTFTKSMKLAQLYEAKIKNDTNHLTQLISYNSIKSRLDETNERNTEIEAEMKKLKGDLKESSKEYATIKPQIDLLKSELDYNKNVIIANCNNQIMMSKGDIDKVIYENQEIERMIKREKHRN